MRVWGSERESMPRACLSPSEEAYSVQPCWLLPININKYKCYGQCKEMFQNGLCILQSTDRKQISKKEKMDKNNLFIASPSDFGWVSKRRVKGSMLSLWFSSCLCVFCVFGEGFALSLALLACRKPFNPEDESLSPTSSRFRCHD